MDEDSKDTFSTECDSDHSPFVTASHQSSEDSDSLPEYETSSNQSSINYNSDLEVVTAGGGRNGAYRCSQWTSFHFPSIITIIDKHML